MPSALARIQTLVARLGLQNACWYLAGRVLSRATGNRARIHRYLLTCQKVPERALLPERRGRDIDIVQVERDSEQRRSFPRPAHILEFRYAQDVLCFAAYKNDEFVGYIWLCLHAFDEDEVRCTFLPLPEGRAAWDFDVYVVPQFRNGIGFLKLWDHAYRYLRERDVRWTMSRISAFNAESIASHQRMGATVVASATFIVLGNWQCVVSNVRPFLHFSIHARPTIEVAPPGED